MSLHKRSTHVSSGSPGNQTILKGKHHAEAAKDRPLFVVRRPGRRGSQVQKRAVDALNRFREKGSGYFMIQATRPQTVGYGLMDSPAGLAGWIYDILQQRHRQRRQPGGGADPRPDTGRDHALLVDRYGDIIGALLLRPSRAARQAQRSSPRRTACRRQRISARTAAPFAKLGQSGLSQPRLLE